MKEVKKQYRENYEQLKSLRGEVYYIQQSIDSLKQQLVSSFEDWYLATFEQEQDNNDNIVNLYGTSAVSINKVYIVNLFFSKNHIEPYSNSQ